MSKGKKPKKHNDFFFVCKHVKFSWGLIILAAIVGSLQSVLVATVPDATANLFDGDFSPSKLWGVFQTLGTTLLLGLISYIARMYAEAKSVLAARTSVWERMVNAGMTYYDENDPASRLSMITTDAQYLGNGLVQLFIFVPTMAVLMISCFAQLAAYSSKLLAVLWVLIPMHVIYLIFVGRWQLKLGKEISGQIGDLTGYLAERIRNLPMIKAFAMERKEEENGDVAINKLFQVNKKYNVHLAVVNNSYQTLSAVVSSVAATLWGCYLLKTGQTDLTSFLAFSMYVSGINTTFMVLAIIWGYIKDFLGRAHRLARMIEAPQEAINTKEKVNTKILQGDITAEGVSFTYGASENPVFSNVSFTIPMGKTTAIVGPSGSGKSTFIKLLERLYAPTEGSIRIGGTDIQGIDLQTWRRHISYVVQDAGVFSGTIRQALCYSIDRSVNDEELYEVCRKVGLEEHIRSLPDGLDTQLSGWGGSVSGGQRQRIAIARAMLRDAEIFIFDEPTSALDPETANAISKIIFEGFSGKTIVVISHELGYIAQSDHIVVLHDGKVEGEGVHSALMDNCPVYRDLVEEQSYQEVFKV